MCSNLSRRFHAVENLNGGAKLHERASEEFFSIKVVVHSRAIWHNAIKLTLNESRLAALMYLAARAPWGTDGTRMVAIAIRVSPVSAHQRRPLPSSETSMKLVTIGHALAGLALAALQQQAGAQSIRSPMNLQARSSVGISVSVRPQFPVSISDRMVSVSSNISSHVRYSVLVQPSEGRPLYAAIAEPRTVMGKGILSFASSARDADTEFGTEPPQLVLIVPD